MPLASPEPIDTRPLFRPVSGSLVTLLRGLPSESWDRSTVAGAWVVRDVVAHLLDSTLPRLSFHRDGMTPLPPPNAIASERDFVAFINDLNAQSWAGEQASEGWFDIGREFTELWHHQQQIRMAVGAASLVDPKFLAAVIDVAIRGLPHAFRDVPAERGQTVTIDISGASGSQWTLLREAQHWTLWRGEPSEVTSRIRLDDDTAWKLLFNAMPERDAAEAVLVEGSELGFALLRARSVIV